MGDTGTDEDSGSGELLSSGVSPLKDISSTPVPILCLLSNFLVHYLTCQVLNMDEIYRHYLFLVMS